MFEKIFKYLAYIAIVFAILSGIVIHKATSWFVNDYHFSSLAQSFVHNNLFLSPINLPPGDFVDFKGKQYLFFGPMPSILLTPFVLIWGRDFPQFTLSVISIAVVYESVYLLLRKFKFKKVDTIYLASFFTFGTVFFFVSLVNISAYVVQAVATAFFVLALLEYFGKRRWLVIGFLTACAIATRWTLIGLCAFFVLEIYRQKKTLDLTNTLRLFLIPIIFVVLLLSFYNFKRFGSFFDTGYTRNVSVLDKSYYNYKLGWFSPLHIPANLYALFVMAPEPVKRTDVEFALRFPYLKANGYGMAIWFTSPLFIYLIKIRKETYTLSAVAAIFILLFPSLVYFGIGSSQFGYRYSLDFLPLLFLILISAFRKSLPHFAKGLIVFGIVFNCFYMLSIWNIYPLVNFWVYLKDLI